MVLNCTPILHLGLNLDFAPNIKIVCYIKYMVSWISGGNSLLR